MIKFFGGVDTLLENSIANEQESKKWSSFGTI